MKMSVRRNTEVSGGVGVRGVEDRHRTKNISAAVPISGQCSSTREDWGPRVAVPWRHGGCGIAKGVTKGTRGRK